MSTIALKIVRYRGRYYCYDCPLDSPPLERLEKTIQAEILTKRKAYVRWLAEQHNKYEVLRKRLEDYLSVRPYDAGEEPRENGRSTSRPELDSSNSGNLPSYMPETRYEHGAKWDYVVDFDREVFAINQSAHLKLYGVPEHGWVRALLMAARGDYIILPGLVPTVSRL